MSSSLAQSHKVLFLNTLAFILCFACWTMNGVLVAFLTDKGIFDFSVVQIGWLLGIPVLTGSLLRLPLGIMTDRYGGKYIFIGLLLFCALFLFLLPFATSFLMFATISFMWGMVGASFAVGVGYTSVWYPKEWQGRALGIFGVGNAGAALTTFIAPSLLNHFSQSDPQNGWKMLPVIYGISLIVVAVLMLLFAKNKKYENVSTSLAYELSPLKSVRVWRFGLYYFLVFGFFIAFSQWLVPYFMNVYATSLVVAGLFASCFSLPGGVIRAVGGFLADKFGARKVMYWVLGSSVIISFLLMFPKMDIFTGGVGVSSGGKGTVTEVAPDRIVVGTKEYKVNIAGQGVDLENNNSVFPSKASWQEVVVKQNQDVKKKELLAKGITHIHFSANMWIFIVLVFMLGFSWAIGKAAVYRYIPDYFPKQVGVVGGIVGLIGGLGGFVGPIIFGYILNYTGFWTSSWIFIFLLSILCLALLIHAVSYLNKKKTSEIQNNI
ncbi:MAG: MFS transporter [Candidatus Azobacteroides sp.]|nr:MFS transporter [Candidatus Azobacteroides sp.]